MLTNFSYYIIRKTATLFSYISKGQFSSELLINALSLFNSYKWSITKYLQNFFQHI